MFASAVSVSFLNLMYHGASMVVHLLLLKGTMGHSLYSVHPNIALTFFTIGFFILRSLYTWMGGRLVCVAISVTEIGEFLPFFAKI